MNSLQFSNDVIQVTPLPFPYSHPWISPSQIAHPTIGHHLLQYIYHGFLVPVLGPSIHQVCFEEASFSERMFIASRNISPNNTCRCEREKDAFLLS